MTTQLLTRALEALDWCADLSQTTLNHTSLHETRAAIRAHLEAQPAPQALTDEPRYTLQEIADACVYADVSDSKFESISIELNRITAPKGTT
jgi:hypothetical protein